MPSNKTVYTLDLDVNSALQNYKKLIDTLKSSGGDPKAIKDLESAMAKLESQFGSLKTEAATGFTDSKGLTKFSKGVGDISVKMQQLGTRIKDVASNAENFPNSEFAQATKEIEKINTQFENLAKTANSDLIKSLGQMGFSKEQAANIAASVKSEEDLIAKIEEERQERMKASSAAAEGFKIVKQQIASDYMSKGGKTAIFGIDLISSTIKQEFDDSEGTLEAFETLAKEHLTNALSKGIDPQNAMQSIVSFAETFESELGEGFAEAIKKSLEDAEPTISGVVSNITTKANATKEGKAYAAASSSYQAIGGPGNSFSAGADATVSSYGASMEQLNALMERAAQLTSTLDSKQQALLNSMNGLKSGADGANSELEQQTSAVQQDANAMANAAAESEQLAASFDQMTSRIKNLLSIGTIFNTIKNVIKQTFNDVQNLDKSFASIAMVTNQTVGGLWGSYDQYAALASKLGQSTNDVVQASALFYQQGLDTAEALSLTEDTMKLATLAGNDFKTATSEMTAALRGFKMEMDEGSHVTDVYSELAAHAAASVDDIALAMQRTASIANSAGMSFENTSAFLTQMIETTQESAENIGTSMKTIIARFTELKDNVAGTADSEFDDLDFNKVDKALKSVGVSLKDTSGQFRNLDEVFLELSSKWDSLDRNTQRYVATIAAGSRQQSRFIAMMDNYDRTVELMETAADAEGKADEQFAKYADTMEYKLNQLNTTWEQFRVDLMNTDLFNPIIEKVTEFVQLVNSVDFHKFSGKAFAAEIAIMVVSIKNLIVNFLKIGKTLAGSAKKIGEKISTSITKSIEQKWEKSKINKKLIIKPEVDAKIAQDRLKVAENQLTQEINRFNNSKIGTIVIANEIKNDDGIYSYLSRIKPQLQEAGVSVQEFIAECAKVGEGDAAKGFKKLRDEIIPTQQKYKEAGEIAERSNKKMEDSAKKAAAVQNVLSTALHAGATALMGYVSGTMSASEAFKVFSASVLASIAPMAAAAIAEAALNGLKVLGEKITKGYTKAKQSETGAHVANTIAMIAEELAMSPLLLMVLALVAAFILLAAVVLGVVAAFNKSKKAKAQDASATEAYNKEQERLSKALDKTNEKLSEQKDKLSDVKSNMDLLTQAEDDYLDKKYLTAEEEENWLALQQDIAAAMPNLIDHYDEQGNAILKTGDAFTQAKEEAEDYYNEINKATADTELEVATLEFEQSALELDKVNEQIEMSENKWIRYLETVSNANVVGRDNAIDGLTEDLKTTGWGDDSSAMALLKGLEKNGKYDQAAYIIEALKSTGAASDFGIGDDTSVWDAIDKIEDKLNDGNEKKEQATLKVLQDALKDYSSGLEGQRQEALQAVKQQEVALNTALINDISAAASGTEIYSNASSKNVQSIMDSYVQQTHDLTLDTFKLELQSEHSDWFEVDDKGVFQVLPEYIKEYNQELQRKITEASAELDADNLGEELGQVFTQEQQAAIDNYFSTVEEKSLGTYEKLDELKKQNENGLIDDTVYETMIEMYSDDIAAREKQNEELAKLLGISDEQIADGVIQTNDVGAITAIEGIDDEVISFYGKLGETAQTEFINSMTKVANEKGEFAALKLAEQYAEAFSDIYDPNGDISSYMMSIDWSIISTFNEESNKEQIIKDLTETYGLSKAKAEELYESASQIAKETGELNTKYLTESSIAAIELQTQQIAEAMEKNKDILNQFSGNLDETIALSSEQYDSIVAAKSALLSAGIPQSALDDVLEYDETLHSWVLNGKKWNEVIDEYGLSTSERLKEQLDYNKELLKSSNLTEEEREEIEAANIALEEAILNTDKLNSRTAEALGYWKSITDTINDFSSAISSFESAVSKQNDNGYLDLSTITSLSSAMKSIDSNFQINDFVDDQLQLNTDALYNYIEAQILELETSGYLNGAEEEELLMWKALRRELQTVKNETIDGLKSVEEAQEDYNDALDAYNDQLETVAEKQETLNEKLEAYNELLYGSENRKSSLDYLYNYDEAINSFNDEISRAQDLLSDASSMDEATSALERYASATHNLIAEETAKQQVLQAGLANYADKIENGSYSYTNQETGEVTNINFGDYARKDERTGKYVIDQRLINESNFGDDWKDLLEEQVSNYNKYSEDLLKSEDNVRKAEKALRDERENALKSYVALEDKVKEVLKAEYQEQVDNLTDMYDSMKEADDDYISALQEAIEKQRELREQENAWEDLAQKEKKLSLMQRDTSGANQVETMELEEEIQEDRESLLDDAIDNIIDGLSDLYESQSELRDAELELKEALLENDAYWAGLSEATVQGFTDLDDATEWYLQHSLELTDMTAAGAESDILSFQDTYSTATEYMAMQLMDETSETGDFINDAINVTGEEAMQIVQETSETFTTEAQRAFDETQATFEADMEKAEQDIKDAKDALQEAVDKLGELAEAARLAAIEYENAKAAKDKYDGLYNELYDDNEDEDNKWASATSLYGIVNALGADHNALDDISKKMDGNEESFAMIRTLKGHNITTEQLEKVMELSGLSPAQIGYEFGLNGNAVSEMTRNVSEEEQRHRVANALITGHKFAEGGLVDYTGPAWVDGTTSRPEAFLSADDTERIGNAARILADIPWIDRDTDNSTVVTNNGGDVSVEINLNIDHISSDTDIDDMIERVKEEIVEVARPTGTNVILQQQL